MIHQIIAVNNPNPYAQFWWFVAVVLIIGACCWLDDRYGGPGDPGPMF